MFTGWYIHYEEVLRGMKWNWDGIRQRHYMCLADNVQSLNATWIFIPFKLFCVNKDTWRSFWRDRDISKIKTIDHTSSFGILSFTHYALKTKEVESDSNACIPFSAKTMTENARSFPQILMANVMAAYSHLPNLLIVYVQLSDSTQSRVTFKLQNNR